MTPSAESWRTRVDQSVGKIPVILPPPEEDDVDDVVGVLRDEFGAARRRDRVQQILGDVVVLVERLHQGAGRDPRRSARR